MKTYLLTAAGVIFIAVIVSLLVPEGKLNKSINFIIRLICIFALVQPLTGVFTPVSSSDFKNYIDYEYVSEVYAENQSEALERLLAEKQGVDAECAVTVVYEEGQFKVSGVSVKLSENNSELINSIYEYLSGLDYINITVYAEST